MTHPMMPCTTYTSRSTPICCMKARRKMLQSVLSLFVPYYHPTYLFLCGTKHCSNRGGVTCPSCFSLESVMGSVSRRDIPVEETGTDDLVGAHQQPMPQVQEVEIGPTGGQVSAQIDPHQAIYRPREPNLTFGPIRALHVRPQLRRMVVFREQLRPSTILDIPLLLFNHF